MVQLLVAILGGVANIVINFNSTMVQLLAITIIWVLILCLNFNSTMVQLLEHHLKDNGHH